MVKMRIYFLCMLCVALTAFALSVEVVQAVNCSTALEANTVYTLSENIHINKSTCFNVSVENVTIDCGGYAILGNNTKHTYGVYSNKYNTTIQNCHIGKFHHGIFFLNATQGIIENNNISIENADGFGIFLNSSNYNTVRNCRVETTESAAIYIYSSNYNNITFSNFTSQYYGIDLFRSDNNLLNNLRASSVITFGTYILESNNNTIINSFTNSSNIESAYLRGDYNNISNNEIAGGILTHDDYCYNFIDNNIDYAGRDILHYGNQEGVDLSEVDISQLILCNVSHSSFTNINLTNDKSIPYFVTHSSYNNFSSFFVNSNGADSAIYFGETSDNFIYNHTIISKYTGIYFANITSSTISNINVTSVEGGSISLATGSSNNILRNIRASSPNSEDAVSLIESPLNNLINITIISESGNVLKIAFGSSNNTVYNSTLISTSNTNDLLYIDAESANNKIYLNNFTHTSGYYVRDLNRSNYYNETINGRNEGNIYFNVMNGGVNITGSLSSSFDGLYVGDSGPGYPYNETNSNGKIVGGTDYAPLTKQRSPPIYCSNLNTTNEIYVLTENLQINGSTCFNVSVENVTIDCNNYSITGNNSPNTYGIYSDVLNTTIKNCNIYDFDYGIYFNGTDNGTISNSEISTNSYGIYLFSGSDSNTILSNTLKNNSESLLYVSSSYNFIYWNNFTSTSGYYIKDTGNNNYYNTSVSNVAQGNYYIDIQSLRIYDSDNDDWGNKGEDYPLDSTQWPTKWNGYGTDYGPATTQEERRSSGGNGDDDTGPDEKTEKVSKKSGVVDETSSFRSAIYALVPANFVIENKFPVIKISFIPLLNISNVSLKVSQYVADSVMMEGLKDSYAFFKINTNISDSDIRNATIIFYVKKDWLSEHEITTEEIVLVRWNNGWSELETSVMEIEDDRVVYITQTPGFSTFGVTTKSETSKTENQLDSTEDEEYAEVITPEKTTKKISIFARPLTIIIIFIFVIAVVFGSLYFRIKKS